MVQASTPEDHKKTGETRRDFLDMVALGTAAIGAGAIAWPFIDSMNPSADVLALSSTDFDLSKVAQGQAVTITWRGKPVFVKHRTEEEIEQARSVDVSALKDPAADEERVVEAPWLILVGICTHLGCVPLGTKSGEDRGEFGGWFCPCHGSHYDLSGRIRKGPAPTNLTVPEYEFLDEQTVRIG